MSLCQSLPTVHAEFFCGSFALCSDENDTTEMYYTTCPLM